MAGRSVLLAAALAGLFLLALGDPELSDPDESRHAEIAREMLAEHQFLTPRLGGEPYYDKPVGFHWLVAASIAALGPTTVAARLPSALAALATVATAAWWAASLYGAAAGRWAAALLASNFFFLALGRFAGLDMLFTSLLTGAVALLSVHAPRRDGVHPPACALRSAYALIGLAALVKGPVAMVLFATAWAGAATGAPSGWRRLRPLSGIAIAIAIALPWYLAAAWSDLDYMRTFLATHNVARFVGDADLPHQSSVGYYAAGLPLMLLPWTPYYAAALASHRRLSTSRPGERVAIAWVGGVVLFFAVAHTRLVTYCLPVVPALAVITAGRVAAWCTDTGNGVRRFAAWFSRIVSSIIGTAVLAAAVLAGTETGDWVRSGPIVLAAASFLAAMAHQLRGKSPSLERALGVLAASVFVAALGAYGPVAQLLTRAKGYRCLASALAPVLTPETSVLRLSRAAYSLSFYAGRNIVAVADRDAARSELQAPGPVLLLTKKAHAEALVTDLGARLDVLWRNAQGTTLLANPSAAERWRRREGVEPSADLDGRHHGFEDRSGHRTRSLSSLDRGCPP